MLVDDCKPNAERGDGGICFDMGFDILCVGIIGDINTGLPGGGCGDPDAGLEDVAIIMPLIFILSSHYL